MDDEREFEDRIFDIYAGSRVEEDIERGFERLAQRLLEARGFAGGITPPLPWVAAQSAPHVLDRRSNFRDWPAVAAIVLL